MQFATLPVGIATDTVTGLVGATTESNDYSRQYRQNQETIAAMHSMDAATLFKSIGNLTERQQQNNREAADKAAFWRDFSQSLNQKAQQNPISASAMDIAARTVGLRFGAGAAAAGMGRTATEGMVRNGFGSFGSGSFAHAAEAMAAKRAAAETKAKVAAEAEALKRIGANQSARKAENAALSNRQPGEFAARQQAKRERAAEAADKNAYSSKAGKPNLQLANDSYLKNKGFHAHSIKEEFFGKGKNSLYDLYIDKNTREILIFRKGGTGKGVKTGYYID